MSGLREPSLGPIVGHTTDTTCKLWIRGEDPQDSKSTLVPESRTIGVITLKSINGNNVDEAPTYYFRLHREYDRTGTFEFGKDTGIGGKDKDKYTLQPDTNYTVRTGIIILDDPFPDDIDVQSESLCEKLPPPRVWRNDLLSNKLDANKTEANFQTFPPAHEISDNLSFILGSCRYPGLLWRIKHSDRIFSPISNLFTDPKQEPSPKFVLMVGDQIYADMFNRRIPIGLADTFEEFQERYHTAFGSTNMRTLLRNVPSYMILDDHEIEDNWTQDRFDNGSKRFLFNLAMSAYMSYQWVHGPRTYENRLYYKFNCAGYPFFVLDTRTQRYLDDIADNLEDNHMLGRPSLGGAPTQLDRLLGWLAEVQEKSGNVPKFIVTSSVFVPNPIKARNGSSIKQKEQSDSWPGFPTTRKKILNHIIEHDIQNVIFLAGDIHCSNIAEMSFTGTESAQTIRAFSITSSALYWPFPFADGDPSNFVHDSTDPEQSDSFQVSGTVAMNYRAWNFTQQDNFCRIDIDKSNKTIRIRAFDTWGNQIMEETKSGKTKKIDDKFILAEW